MLQFTLKHWRPRPLVFGIDILGWGLEILESPQRITWLSHWSAGCHGNTSSSVSVWCFWGTSKSQCFVALTHIEQHGATWPAMHQRGKWVCYCLWFLTAFLWRNVAETEKWFCYKKTWSRNNWSGWAPHSLCLAFLHCFVCAGVSSLVQHFISDHLK